MSSSLLLILTILIMTVSASSSEQLKSYNLDSLDAVIDHENISVDTDIKSEGVASLRLVTESPKVFHLIETGDIDIENSKIVYSAHIKTQNVDGLVYLEMWCVFNDRGEYFSRALNAPLTSTNNWTIQQTPFFLKSGENPDNIKLNLVINGKGTVWIDDINLIKMSLD